MQAADLKISPSQERCVVVLPSFNSGKKLAETVAEVFLFHSRAIVVLDACTDDSEMLLRAQGWGFPELEILKHPVNLGKGACVLSALDRASERGFELALVMDADGQHPAREIQTFFGLAEDHPGHMVLGVPVFGPDAPAERVRGRKIGNWWTNLETLWGGIGDSLFGFRVYPVETTRRILHSIKTARRFDFDTEIAVRLFWSGIQPINRSVPVRYPPKEQGGVSHFRYLRDNLLLAGTHTRLVFGMLLRLPLLLRGRQDRLPRKTTKTHP